MKIIELLYAKTFNLWVPQLAGLPAIECNRHLVKAFGTPPPDTKAIWFTVYTEAMPGAIHIQSTRNLPGKCSNAFISNGKHFHMSPYWMDYLRPDIHGDHFWLMIQCVKDVPIKQNEFGFPA